MPASHDGLGPFYRDVIPADALEPYGKASAAHRHELLDLDRRLWRYAIAYTLRHIIFWPPDRAEADGLDPGHPLHTLRRLIDAPLPLPAGGISGLPSYVGRGPRPVATRRPLTLI